MIKTCRTGLGEASERKRRVEEQKAMRAAMARKRQRHELEWKESLRAKVVNRELERDLAQSQKVCEQLDSEQVILSLLILKLFIYNIIHPCWLDNSVRLTRLYHFK